MHLALRKECAPSTFAVSKAAKNVLAGLDGRLGPGDVVNPEVSGSG